MLATMKRKLRNEEGAEAIVWIGLAILALVMVGLISKFIIPAFSQKAEDIGKCISDSGQTTDCSPAE